MYIAYKYFSETIITKCNYPCNVLVMYPWWPEPQIIFIGILSEESFSCDSSWLRWGSHCSDIRSCCTCGWNIWYLWNCAPIAPPMLPCMYHWWRMLFWAIIVKVSLVTTTLSINTFFTHNFVSYFFIYASSHHCLVSKHSCTINVCFKALYQHLKLVSWIRDHLV